MTACQDCGIEMDGAFARCFECAKVRTEEWKASQGTPVEERMKRESRHMKRVKPTSPDQGALV